MDQSHQIDFKLEDSALALPFHWSPFPLEVLASKQIAVLLLSQKVHNIDPYASKIITVNWLFDQSFDICALLHVPRVIGDAIYSSMKHFCSRIQDWMTAHAAEILIGHHDHEVIARCIDFLESDNDKIVARKLLDSNVLNSEEQYRLACKYCWINDIERLWPSVSNEAIITLSCFDDAKLVYYWNCKMMGIPPMGLPGNWRDPIEFRMISDYDLDDWLAIEYFWDKLNAEERLSIVTEVLERTSDDRILMSILPKLNKIELNRVLKESTVHILPTLAPFVKYFDYVLLIWKYFCKFASISQLNDVLFGVWLDAYEFVDANFTADQGYQTSIVVYELWIHAPIEFRQFFSTTDRGIILFDYMSDTGEDVDHGAELYGRDMNFMLEVLKIQKFATRNEIWRRNWLKFIVRAKPLDLDRFIRICFENDDEIVRFKEDVMMNYDRLEFIFEKFIKEGHTSKLLDYVDFCASDQQRVENLKRRILALHFRLIRSNVETFRPANFDKFLFGTFSNVEFAKQFRAEYVLAYENELLPVLLADLDVGCLANAIKICDYLTYELCPSQVKREFLEHCKRYLIDCHITEFEINHWREFVTSCAGNEENARMFKESIPVDQVFDKIFTEIAEILSSSRGNAFVTPKFTLLDDFLLWYFDNVDAVMDYKRTQLDDDPRSKVNEILATKDAVMFADEVLWWIFNDDMELVDRYYKTTSFRMYSE